MEFHTRTILPQKTGNEKEIARKLIGFKDYGTRDIHICEDPLMVMDPERRAKVAQLKMQAGLCTVNEGPPRLRHASRGGWRRANGIGQPHDAERHSSPRATRAPS